MTIPWLRDPKGYHEAVSQFVRGFRNTKPTPEEFNMTLEDKEFKLTQSPTFAFKKALNTVKKENTKNESSVVRQPLNTQIPKGKFKLAGLKSTKKEEVNLRGSGITKRALEAGVKEHEKDLVSITPTDTSSIRERLPKSERPEVVNSHTPEAIMDIKGTNSLTKKDDFKLSFQRELKSPTTEKDEFDESVSLPERNNVSGNSELQSLQSESSKGIEGEILPPLPAPEEIEKLRPAADYSQALRIPEPEIATVKKITLTDLLHKKKLDHLDTLHLKVEELKRAEVHKHSVVAKAAEAEERILQLTEEELGKNIILDTYQQAALEGLSTQKYGCLIGAAGTGKTTVERQLAELLETTTPIIDLNNARLEREKTSVRELRAAICFCAFTGRAVQQMKRALPEKYHPLCATIHKTLGYAPVDEEYFDNDAKMFKIKRIFRPTFTADNQLPFKVCVVDETGMLGIPLSNELIAALPEDCRIIFIGDINQLPPVQGRSVLGFAMLKWPTFTLEKIHRQAADNPIIANAHRILKGERPIADPKKFAMMEIPFYATKALEAAFTGKANALQQLIKKQVFDPYRDAIITTTNGGILGQINLNQFLVMRFNPKQTIDSVVVNKRHIISAGYIHCHFAIGDKIMLLQNDSTRQLTNGMTGVVTDVAPNDNYIWNKSAHSVTKEQAEDSEFSVADMTDIMEELNEEAKKDILTKKEEDVETTEHVVKDETEDEGQRPASHILTANFGAGASAKVVQFSTAGQFKKITHAYAFTCHKSQGGEYETVVIVLHQYAKIMLNREWLYTAVTRAKERVVLLYTKKALNQALKVQRISGNTVQEKAMQFMELQKLDDVKLPYLPEPEEI